MLSPKKKRDKVGPYPAETITDADYADNLEILLNVLSQRQELLLTDYFRLKFELSEKIKNVNSFKLEPCYYFCVVDETLERKKLDGNYTRILSFCFEKIVGATPRKTATIRLLISYLTNHTFKMNKTCWAQLENRKFSGGRLYMYTPMLANQQIRSWNFLRTLDAVKKTCHVSMAERERERER